MIRNRDFNEEYAEYENAWLESGRTDKNAYCGMFLAASCFIQSQICKYCHNHNLHFSEEELQDKTHTGLVWLFGRYQNDPDFRLDKLTSYGSFAVKKALFSDLEYEKRVCSLDAMLEK